MTLRGVVLYTLGAWWRLLWVSYVLLRKDFTFGVNVKRARFVWIKRLLNTEDYSGVHLREFVVLSIRKPTKEHPKEKDTTRLN